jgi:prolyl-tRNA synthetase
MLFSKYLLPVFRETPSDAVIVSHRLMLRTSMIRQVTSGIYTWLPLGLRILQKVQNEVRKVMNSYGGIEVLLPMLQPSSWWEKSGRYGWGTDMMQETLKVKDRHDVEMFFAPTAEEVMTQIFAETVFSYKELPKNLYQISTKFRDEIRPRYGVMRSREFYMKDAYSFDLTKKDALANYDLMLRAYLRIFSNLGMRVVPVLAGTGDIGGDYSHELHVTSESGESKIFFDKGILQTLKKEDFDLQSLEKFYSREEGKHNAAECSVSANNLVCTKGIEVGQLFYLGDQYSKSMGVKVQLRDGSTQAPLMGCYGIGISRVVAAAIEVSNDERGIVWHPNMAPFTCVVVNLKVGDDKCDALAKTAYENLLNAGFEVLYDDRDVSVGVKLGDSDLIGIPLQIIVGPRKASENLIEVKIRSSGEISEIDNDGVVNYCRKMLQSLGWTGNAL